MSSKNLFGLVIVGLVLIVGANSFFVLFEHERGVVLRFGRMVDDNVQPGLHFKLPFADRVRKFDGRVLTVDADEASFFTSENKRLIVNSYVKWRVSDVGTFYRATQGDEDVASSRLASRTASGLRDQFGQRTLYQVVSGDRDGLMAELNESLDKLARDLLGIEVVDIRVKRIDLPDDVSQSVFARMEQDREKEAAEYRAQGREQAEVIRADADRQRTILEANAYRESERIRGDGDARASAIYAEAFEQDPDFYAFTRSIHAYRASFATKEDLLVLDPESEFFRFMNDSQGGQ